ncbi:MULTISPECIES: cellulase family glycosylhydrolase [Peribacillus]|uniref:cellulase family glycosylhydrolase n=1 Tax=Peribacillus TaxID=2675229 RepID=UPI001F4EDEFE|nr:MULTISPECIES: cellulase family glycosylhydrolase [unclassified Peribacillus]MCK1981949.1 cellulase family glycosylhydrolase [Peribacillus sp. Aquil_B1]MCK2010007.1 cellulase family glycosylhydrolase [Peribacillus sp. Aquil_B8]
MKNIDSSRKLALIIVVLFFLSMVFYIFFAKENPKEDIKEEGVFEDSKTIPEGIGVHIYGQPTDHEFQLMKDAGVKWARFDLAWTLIENEKGIYDFSSPGFDNIVAKLKKYGIKPYFILAYSNSLYEKKRSIVTDEGRTAYSNFVMAATKRYKDQGAIWEIWNEPNLPYYWQDQPSYSDYVLLVKRVASVIKESDHTGIIVAPAVSGISGKSLEWFKEVFSQGILEDIDAVSVHPYRVTNPETVVVDYNNLKNIISKYTNKPVPILSGEWGYHVKNSNNLENGELNQAKDIIRMLLVNHSKGIPISILYEWKNSGDDSNNMHDNYGLMWDENKPKSSYYALKAFSSILSGYSFKEKIEVGQRDDYILKFSNSEGKQVIVFWTTGPNHYLSLNYPSGKGKLISILGEKQEIEWNQDQLSLKLSGSPCYLIIE